MSEPPGGAPPSRGPATPGRTAARWPRAGRAPLDLLPALLLLALLLFVGAQAWASRGTAIAHGVKSAVTPVAAAAAAAAQARSAESPAARAERARALLRANAGGTYIHAILGVDSVLRRWPNAASAPLRVWVQPSSPLAGWRPAYGDAARAGFRAWSAAAPLSFAFTADSATADIRVRWADRLAAETQVGNNRLVYDQFGVVVAAEVTLAVHDTRGQPLPTEVLRVVALHEAGHAIGLGHSPDPRDVMAARYDRGTTRISAADARTARLLYLLPPGDVRAR